MDRLEFLFLSASIASLIGYYLRLKDYQKNEYARPSLLENNSLAASSNLAFLISVIGFHMVIETLIEDKVFKGDVLNMWIVKYLLIPLLLIFLINYCLNWLAFISARKPAKEPDLEDYDSINKPD